MTEAAPDTERELPPLDEDDDVVEKTLPFRRRAPDPILSFVKAQPVIVIGFADDAPPVPLASHELQTLRMNVSPMVPGHAMPAYAVPAHAAPSRVADPLNKRAPRWPFFAAAALLFALTGVGGFFARHARFFDRAQRASASSAPSASAEMPAVAAPTPTAAPSLASVDPSTVATPSASTPALAPTAPVARRPILMPPPAWPRPTGVAPAVAPSAASSTDPTDPLAIAALPATGKLTVLCVPGCDQVFDGARPLGASPVFKMVTTTGVHHLTLVTTDPPMKKRVDVNVVEDETTLVREEMK